MQSWSDVPSNKDFGVKFFLDTNLLIYLIDNTYQSINDFIEILIDCPFVELVSSNYVMLEFVGSRKREHYFRLAAHKYLTLPNGKINFGSLIKHKDDYSIPRADFESLANEIKNEVNQEVEKISTQFKINYEFSTLHEGQLKPTIDICLSSKISNQDSLVLVSSVLTHPNKNHSNVVLLTNDHSFVSSYIESKIETTLSGYSINAPNIYSINSINVKGCPSIALKQENNKDILRANVKRIILKLIVQRLNSFYMGKTFIPKNALPEGVICFKLNKGFVVRRNIYITVISKDLDFIYTSKKVISALQYSNSELSDGYISKGIINVAYKLVDINEEGLEVSVQPEIISAIRCEGNFVFIHPDTQLS